MISLDKFKQDILRHATTKSSRFIVEVFPPSSISEYDTERLTFRCDSAELPGRTLPVVEQRTHGVGRKQPQGSVFADLNLTLICSSTFTEKKFFDHWQDLTHNLKTYKFGYFDDYVGTVYVTQLNDELQPIYRIELTDAFPMLVAPMPLNWETSNDLQRVQVTISYRQWTESDTTLDAPNLGDRLQEQVGESLNRLVSLDKLNVFKLLR